MEYINEEIEIDINLSSAAFIPQEIKNLVVRVGEPSSGHSTEDEPTRLAGLRDLSGGDSDSVVGRIRKCGP